MTKTEVKTKMEKEKISLRKVFEWEDMDFDYIQYQLNGLLMEISKPHEAQHTPYIREKIHNILRDFQMVVENFGHRIEHPELQEDFLKKLNKEVQK